MITGCYYKRKKTNIDAERCLTCLKDNNNENKTEEQTNKYKKMCMFVIEFN